MAALHWIQQNIEKFGGNPSMITLAGHGTGAACIDFLMSSPSMGTLRFNLFYPRQNTPFELKLEN